MGVHNMTDAPRVFHIPFRSITMSERRLMATRFGVNWDAVEIDLVDVPRPDDPDNPTDAEKIAAAKAFSRIVGPNEKFALAFVAARRELPSVAVSEVERRFDAGDWALSFGGDVDDEGDDPAPLPPPTGTTSSASS